MTVVLRKSVGSYSAGTNVDSLDSETATELQLTDTVKLRPRSTVVPLKNRAALRAENAKARQILATLKGV